MLRLLRLVGSLVERRPGRVLLGLLAVTVVLGGFASQQRTDTDMTAFAPDGELADALIELEQDFAASGTRIQVIVDAGEGGNVLDAEGRAIAHSIRDAIAGDDLVAPVLADGPSGLVAFPDDPTGSLLSLDRRDDLSSARAGIVHVELRPDLSIGESTEAELRVGSIVEEVVAEREAAGGADAIDVAAVSQALMTEAMMEDSEAEMSRLLGLSFLIIVLILVAQFRRASEVVVALVGLVVAITWMFGIGVLLGPRYLGVTGDFTQVSIIIPVLLVGLGVDYAIHLTFRYREERRHGLTSGRAANAAVRTVGGALALATMTTIVGFMTNITSPLPPLADFGIFTAVGMVSAFVVTALLVPSTSNLLDLRRARRRRTWRTGRVEAHAKVGLLSRSIARTSALAVRAPWAVVVVSLVVTAVAGVAATRIDTEFSQDDFIAADSELGLLLSRVDELFGGDLAETTFVLVDGDVTTGAGAAALDASLARLADIADVRVASGAAQVDVIPGPDGRVALAISTNAGQDRVAALRDDVRAAMEPLAAVDVPVRITSEYLVADEVLDALTASQAQGIALTIVAAMVLLVSYYGVVERRPAIGFLTMVPSVVVVAWVLGTMWLLGYSFNVLTAMVASIGIGIGVPFGIHITHRFLEDRRRHDTIDRAIEETLAHTGAAMTGSAATTAAGFGVLVFASLIPMQQFGAIVAISIAYSLIAAVLVQPSFLRLWADWRIRRGDVVELAAEDDHRVLEPV